MTTHPPSDTLVEKLRSVYHALATAQDHLSAEAASHLATMQRAERAEALLATARADALEMAEALYGSFVYPENGDFFCVHCDGPVDVLEWTTTKHVEDCIINKAIALLPAAPAPKKEDGKS